MKNIMYRLSNLEGITFLVSLIILVYVVTILTANPWMQLAIILVKFALKMLLLLESTHKKRVNTRWYSLLDLITFKGKVLGMFSLDKR